MRRTRLWSIQVEWLVSYPIVFIYLRLYQAFPYRLLFIPSLDHTLFVLFSGNSIRTVFVNHFEDILTVQGVHPAGLGKLVQGNLVIIVEVIEGEADGHWRNVTVQFLKYNFVI